MPTFGQKTIKQVIQEVDSNLASLEKLELIKNASFCMKSAENTVALSAALAKNTVIKDVVLRQCEISDAGAEAIAAALEHNQTIEELDLQDNNITTSGVIALAKGLEKNKGVRTLNLLGQTQKALGDDAVEALIAMFEHNTTLVKIIWKVTSRRSWEVSKLITRNVSIQKAKTSGTDASHLMPTKKPEEASPEPAPALPPTPPLAMCTMVPEEAATRKPATAPAPKPEDADDSSTRAASAVVPSDASAATSGANSPAPKDQGGEAATQPAAAEEQAAPEPPAPAAPEPEAAQAPPSPAAPEPEADEAAPASPAAAAAEPEAGEAPEAAPASPALASPEAAAGEEAAAANDAPQEDSFVAYLDK